MEHEKKSMNISTKDIVVDKNGQRDVEQRRAQFNYIMKNYNPDAVDPLHVAFVDGKYYLYDGQMTMKVVKAKHGGRDVVMRAEVVYGLTLPEVADLFLTKNDPKGTVSVKLADNIRVAANYGSADEMNFIRLVENNGFRIDKQGGDIGSSVFIPATKVLWDQYHLCGDDSVFNEAMYILYNAYSGKKMGTNGKIIRGLCLLVRTYIGYYKASDMASSLQKVSPVDIITEAEGGRRKYQDSYYAEQMAEVYNKHRTRSRLDLSLLQGAK